jgi:hypothetical protein
VNTESFQIMYCDHIINIGLMMFGNTNFCAMWLLCVSKHIFSQLLGVDRRFPILVLGTEDGAIIMWSSSNYS